MDPEPLRILLLEDTDTDAELVERALRRGGLDFVLQRAVAEADFVSALRDFRPDVVLADYRLPSFDGLSALRIVRAASSELPFIVVSGTLGDETAVEVLKLGATDYILKDRLNRLAPAILRARQEVVELAARRRAETLLEESRRLDSLGRMAATIAHEMNNVLMMVRSAADQLQRDPSAALPLAGRIMEAVKRGQRITSEVMRFAKPAQPDRQLLSLNTWLTAFVGDLLGTLGPRYSLQLELPADNPHIVADQHQLEQVLTNLVVNARDAMPRGGVIVLRAAEEAVAGVALIEISVADTGEGMTAETLTHIFEPLFTTKRSGTGLGLAVSYQIVLAHGGQMYAESRPGSGSVLHVLLPHEEPAAEGGDALP
jgi:signal transduction histidine kinase